MRADGAVTANREGGQRRSCDPADQVDDRGRHGARRVHELNGVCRAPPTTAVEEWSGGGQPVGNRECDGPNEETRDEESPDERSFGPALKTVARTAEEDVNGVDHEGSGDHAADRVRDRVRPVHEQREGSKQTDPHQQESMGAPGPPRVRADGDVRADERRHRNCLKAPIAGDRAAPVDTPRDSEYGCRAGGEDQAHRKRAPGKVERVHSRQVQQKLRKPLNDAAAPFST